MPEENIEEYLSEINQLKKDLESANAALESANATAITAMSLNSDLGKVINLIERSYSAPDVEKITELLFNYVNSESLSCIVAIETNNGTMYFSNTSSTVLDKEQELIVKAKNGDRFFDFNNKTIVNFPFISLLIKNMPVDNPEKYGQIKDLVPLLLGSLNEKVLTLNTTNEIYQQSETLTLAFNTIEQALDRIGHSLSDNARGTTMVLSAMLQDLSMTLPSIALEDDQEEFILARIENAVNTASDLANASEHITNDFNLILTKLHEFVVEQETLLNSLDPKSIVGEEANLENDIELF